MLDFWSNFLGSVHKTPDVNPSKLLDSIVNKEPCVFKEISKEELETHKSELSGLCQIGCKNDDIVIKFKESDKGKVENILSDCQKLSKTMK